MITLNGKPTQGSAFGSEVETAMDLVKQEDVSVSYSSLTGAGPNNVSYRVCCHNGKKHEDDCAVPGGKRVQNQRMYILSKLVPQEAAAVVDQVTNSSLDT